jgi:hypothetical protein
MPNANDATTLPQHTEQVANQLQTGHPVANQLIDWPGKGDPYSPVAIPHHQLTILKGGGYRRV